MSTMTTTTTLGRKAADTLAAALESSARGNVARAEQILDRGIAAHEKMILEARSRFPSLVASLTADLTALAEAKAAL